MPADTDEFWIHARWDLSPDPSVFAVGIRRTEPVEWA